MYFDLKKILLKNMTVEARIYMRHSYAHYCIKKALAEKQSLDQNRFVTIDMHGEDNSGIRITTAKVTS